MPDLHERLTAAADDLDKLIDTATRRLDAQIGGYGATAYDIVDQHGQPILAPLMTARANLLAALAMLEAATRRA